MTKKPSKNGHAPKPGDRPPTAYFLSLEVENVRCFGPKQKLDLSDGKGKPAPWTIILGVNGTGKTTLLQCLVMLELQLVEKSTDANYLISSPMISYAAPYEGDLRTIGRRPAELYVQYQVIVRYAFTPRFRP